MTLEAYIADLLLRINNAQASGDWRPVDDALRVAFQTANEPIRYIAALRFTYPERDILPSWYPLRDHLINNSSSDIQALTYGL